MQSPRHPPIASFLTSLLDITWYAVALGLALVLILLAGSTLLDLKGENLTVSLPVAVQLHTPIHQAGEAESAHFEKLQGNLRFPARRGIFLSASVAVVALMFGYILWIVTQLRLVFRSLSQGRSFFRPNARRVRSVGLAVIFGELARASIVYFWSFYASRHFTADGLHFAPSLDLNLIAIVGGLAILVIAQVFAEGTRLDEDQSLTI